eukprot:732325-Amphidinium_carterae.1
MSGQSGGQSTLGSLVQTLQPKAVLHGYCACHCMMVCRRHVLLRDKGCSTPSLPPTSIMQRLGAAAIFDNIISKSLSTANQ